MQRCPDVWLQYLIAVDPLIGLLFGTLCRDVSRCYLRVSALQFNFLVSDIGFHSGT